MEESGSFRPQASSLKLQTSKKAKLAGIDKL
jgi:hypothetical protein